MKILALNCGSSSVKYQLYDWDNKCVISKGIAERVGQAGSFIIIEYGDKETKPSMSISDHKQAIDYILSSLVSEGVLSNISEISAVVHRVVHGGQKFTHSVPIDEEVIRTIDEISYLAPLHNPPNLSGINAARAAMPETPHIAVFDTAFHQTMPEKAYHYAIPRAWYDKYLIRRYGFHGTSHLYVSKRAAALLGKPASECNIITMHIGNGVSVTAIKNGLSIDTSMGMTPLEGAIMGTRSGDIDPSIPLFMQTVGGLPAEEVYGELNKRSGLLGITGKYSDRRDIIAHADEDPDCQLAIDMETYKLKQYVGKYMATLGRTDAIVFTAGVGENSALIRRFVLSGMENFGIKLNIDKNAKANTKTGETEISTSDSAVKVFVVPTNEERVMIEDAVGVLDGSYCGHMCYKYTFL